MSTAARAALVVLHMLPLAACASSHVPEAATRSSVLASAPGQATAAPPTASNPLNVLFVVIDDLRVEIGAYGATQARTPNLDRLAQRGMRFDRAYAQYPVCNPSRASFITGLRPDTTGILDNKVALREKHPDIVTLPQLFRQAGYFTASLGKIIHIGVDPDGEHEHYRDDLSFVDNRRFKATELGLRGEGRNMSGGRLKWCSWLAAEGGDDDQPDGQNATEAIALLEAHRDGRFFIGVGLHKPHDPFNAPKKYFDAYPLEQIRLASEPDDRSPLLPLALPNRHQFDMFTDRERREFRRAYLAGISFVDAQLGRILDTLDRLSLWDKTIVVLIGDHGYHLGEHGWWNKVTVFELGARAPLLMWAPKAKGMGQSTTAIVEFLDLYPTLTELVGLPPPHKLEGRSFRDVLDDPARPGSPAAFTQVRRGSKMGRSVRTDRWRYTEWDEGRGGVELYDHQDGSPHEYYNLADRPELAQVRAEMQALLKGAGK